MGKTISRERESFKGRLRKLVSTITAGALTTTLSVTAITAVNANDNYITHPIHSGSTGGLQETYYVGVAPSSADETNYTNLRIFQVGAYSSVTYDMTQCDNKGEDTHTMIDCYMVEAEIWRISNNNQKILDRIYEEAGLWGYELLNGSESEKADAAIKFTTAAANLTDINWNLYTDPLIYDSDKGVYKVVSDTYTSGVYLVFSQTNEIAPFLIATPAERIYDSNSTASTKQYFTIWPAGLNRDNPYTVIKSNEDQKSGLYFRIARSNTDSVTNNVVWDEGETSTPVTGLTITVTRDGKDFVSTEVSPGVYKTNAYYSFISTDTTTQSATIKSIEGNGISDFDQLNDLIGKQVWWGTSSGDFVTGGVGSVGNSDIQPGSTGNKYKFVYNGRTHGGTTAASATFTLIYASNGTIENPGGESASELPITGAAGIGMTAILALVVLGAGLAIRRNRYQKQLEA